MKSARRMLVGVAACAIAAAFGSPAMADETADRDGLGDIVVTAQKRETKLEKTPMTINVLSGDQVATMGVIEIKSLSAAVPGFTRS